MSMPARAALLLLLPLGFVRLFAAETGELASLRAKAEHGNALAQYNLGLAYAEGRQVPANPAEAFAWLSLASENGATGKALDSLLGNISDAQLAEGRRRLDRYRATVSTQITDTKTHGAPKLAPRGFTVEVPPPTPAPPTTPPVTNPPVTAPNTPPPAGKSPAAVAPPVATTPAGGNAAAELEQARKDLEKAQVDLVNANNELATLRASVTRLEAAASEAKAAETRLTAELAAARQELAALKPAPTPPPAEKTAADKPAAHQP
jgi:hypothetical protein